MVPSSAYVSAISRIISPPRAQEMIAAGPAAVDASSAPKSQPEPMIEPTLANSSPTTPTCLLSWGSSVRTAVAVSVATRTPFSIDDAARDQLQTAQDKTGIPTVSAPTPGGPESRQAQPAENPTLCQPVAPSGTTSVRTDVWV